MQKKTSLATYLIAAIFGILSGGCIHTYPHGEGEDPSRLKTVLSLNLDIDLSAMEKMIPRSEETSTYSNYHIIIELAQSSLRPMRYETYVVHNRTEQGNIDLTLPFTLTASIYDIRIWCDLATQHDNQPLHYDASDFARISRLHHSSEELALRAEITMPLCAYTSSQLDLRQYKEEWNKTITLPFTLSPPVGLVKIVATDTDTFIEHYPNVITGSNYSASLSFTSPVAETFNLLTGEPNTYSSGIIFNSSLVMPSSEASTLLTVPVFTASSGENLTSDLIIYNSAQGIVARTRGLEIPVRRNRTTIVSGDFLSNFFESPLHVEYEWEGEVIIDLTESPDK
ncbi:MAG: hypothetical protein K2K58_11980 [Muribaculaceae bacterium]|nr:hypothetical protein [Muribaculaceae bacterium]